MSALEIGFLFLIEVVGEVLSLNFWRGTRGPLIIDGVLDVDYYKSITVNAVDQP